MKDRKLITGFQKYSNGFTTEKRRTRRRKPFSSVCRETTANERASPAAGSYLIMCKSYLDGSLAFNSEISVI